MVGYPAAHQQRSPVGVEDIQPVYRDTGIDGGRFSIVDYRHPPSA